MHTRRLHFLILALFLLPLSLRAADLAFTLMPPTTAVPAGNPVLVDLVAMNPGILDMPFDAPVAMKGTIGGRQITLEAVSSARRSVAPGAFAFRRYQAILPVNLPTGQSVLEMTPGDLPVLHAVLDVKPPTPVAAAAPVPSATPLGYLTATAPVSSSLARTFAGRFMPNLPIYFLYGNADQAAKFQFSFDYRLATVRWGASGNEKTSTLRLGYTQRSLWDVDAASSPFYDTSYMPEVAVVTDWPLPAEGIKGFTWMGFRVGYQHESNGKDGADSRSLNQIYVRPRFIVGSTDSWYLVVVPEVHSYVGGLDNNPQLKDYRGFATLQMYASYKSGPTLRFNGWAGEDFNHQSYQLDLTYPIRLHRWNIETYLQLQYFNGYGESLRNYDRKSEAFRIGIGLVR